MRSILVSALLLLTALPLLGSGCAREDGLRARGEASLAVEGTEAGFSFVEDTLLAPVGTNDGRIEGECVLPAEKDGLVRLTLARSGDAEGVSIEQLIIEANASHGSIAITTASSTFKGERSATCEIEEGYRDEDLTAFRVDCAVGDESGQTGHAYADLHFSGCTVR